MVFVHPPILDVTLRQSQILWIVRWRKLRDPFCDAPWNPDVRHVAWLADATEKPGRVCRVVAHKI